MKSPSTILPVFFSCLKVLSLNINFENRGIFDSIVNNFAKEYRIVDFSIESTNKSYIDSNSRTFPSASILKLFTATTTIQLIDNKRFRLKDKPIEFLTEFKSRDKRYGKIKIKHFLTHSFKLKLNSILKKSPYSTSAV